MVALMQALNMEVLCLLESTILTTVGRALYLQHQVMPVQHQGEQVANLALSVSISYGHSINADMLRGGASIPWMIERKDMKKLFDR